ncbi:hypothetical protein ES968_22180 (plasmid) [Bacillus subtilis]|uniref:hypothetical protein n=1 Tax=Bacillus subtilis TaxID=1423 RepID=UPI00100A06CF|nr:hypothetical protein [Bacillus subtilis]QAW06672.1 hypothetical protein ES968_22180 [Bacillus subtilis]
MTLSEYTQDLIGTVQTLACLIFLASLFGLFITLSGISRYSYLYLSVLGFIVAAYGLSSGILVNIHFPYYLSFVVGGIVVLVLLPIAINLDRKRFEKRQSRIFNSNQN